MIILHVFTNKLPLKSKISVLLSTTQLLGHCFLYGKKILPLTHFSILLCKHTVLIGEDPSSSKTGSCASCARIIWGRSRGSAGGGGGVQLRTSILRMRMPWTPVGGPVHPLEILHPLLTPTSQKSRNPFSKMLYLPQIMHTLEP